MEIIIAIIIGIAAGIFIGFVIAHSKSKDLQNIIDKLQWQLENEKVNARQRLIYSLAHSIAHFA